MAKVRKAPTNTPKKSTDASVSRIAKKSSPSKITIKTPNKREIRERPSKSSPVKTVTSDNKQTQGKASPANKNRRTLRVQLKRISTTQYERHKNVFQHSDWLADLVRSNFSTRFTRQNSGTQTVMGAEYLPNTALKFKKKNGIEYALYPTKAEGGNSGIVLMKPNTEKKCQKTLQSMKYTVLTGKVKLLSNEKVVKCEAGSIISIPSGIRYSLKNDEKTACFLNFFSY